MKPKVKVTESRTTLELLELTQEWEATSRLLMPLSSPLHPPSPQNLMLAQRTLWSPRSIVENLDSSE